MDCPGPLRFLWDVLIPLAKTNIAALATIIFIYAWDQYLWPSLVITDRASYDMVMVQLSDLVPDQLSTGGGTPTWHLTVTATLIVMLPPIAIVILVQRWCVGGLINTDK
jgi:sn-glycerol 3-phosphate transport system permease protein